MPDPAPRVLEANFDGIVGPTHNYAGLSYGNIASAASEGSTSNPREAAKQGLAKAAFLASLGIPQGFLPPHERPHVPTLRALGFTGRDADVVARAAREDMALLARVTSASAMWTANAATVAPSSDASDGKVHFTPANLRAMFHRSIEPPTTARALRAIFADEASFVHHAPLPATELFSDEGAANHTRFEGTDGRAAQLFVYGKSEGEEGPKRFPARQTLAASQAIARLHALAPDRVAFARQRPESIDGGVFHNDVISVGNGNVLFTHEFAFASQASVLEQLAKLVRGLVVVTVAANSVSVEQAVKSYLFNSQLVTIAGRGMALIAPTESRDDAAVKAALDRVVTDASNSIGEVHFMNLRESMRNGGGPACLRLRVPLTKDELAAVNQRALFTPALHRELEAWMDKHYRTELAPRDIADPKLLEESRAALDDLTKILALGAIYDFQR